MEKLLILITPTSIHGKKLSGNVSYWSILNNYWRIQNIDLLASLWRSLCHIVKHLTHAIPNCGRVKLMEKVWFSVLIRSTFKPFVEVMRI